jgi:DNA-binding Lrp family transcriptional regulator
LEGAKEMYKLKDKIDVSLSADKEFCALVFVALSPEAYHNPERIADSLAKYREVESVDVVAGKWGLVLKIRTNGKDRFYDFLKEMVCEENGIVKTNCIISLKQIKPICSALR